MWFPRSGLVRPWGLQCSLGGFLEETEGEDIGAAGGRGPYQMGVTCAPCLLPSEQLPAGPSREYQGLVRVALPGRTSQALGSCCSGKFGSGSFLQRLAQLSAAWGYSSAHPGLTAHWGQNQMPCSSLALEYPLHKILPLSQLSLGIPSSRKPFLSPTGWVRTYCVEACVIKRNIMCLIHTTTYVI